MLVARKDIFGRYNQETFEASFETRFEILTKEKIKDSVRTVYLMRRKPE